MATLATRLTSTGNLLVNGTFDEVSMPSGSLFFDGTGDYLTVTNSAALQLTNSTAFTIECWVYPTNLTFPQKYILENFNPLSPFQGYGLAYNINSTNAVEWWDGGGTWANTGITLTTNEWTHIAVTYEGSGTTRRFFKNGVLSGSAGTVSSSINYTAGTCSIGAQETNTPWFGYISNLRVIKGTALYTANFTPSIGILESTANTSLLLNVLNSTDFIKDNSPNNFSLTRNGDVAYNSLTPFNRGAHSVSNDTVFTRLSDEVSLAAGSILLDGTDDYLSVADNVALQPGTGAFTIDCWIYRRVANADHTIYAKGGAGTGFQLRVTNTNILRFTNNSTITDSSISIPANVWTHVAVVRGGADLLMFINGVQSGSGSVTTNYNQTEEVRIGTNRVGADDFNGYISCLRFIKGVALYSISGFTPQQFIPDSTVNTSLLLNFLNSTDFKKDSSPNNFDVTVNGNATWNAFGPFNQGVTGLVERRLSNATLVKNQFDEFTGALVVDSSLVVWLDAANPASYPETGTTLTDLSGNGRTLTLFNSPTFVSTDPSLEFNGSTQYGSFSVPAMTDYSLGFWLYIISLPASGEEQIFGSPSDTASISLLFSGGAWKWHSWAGISRVGNAVSTRQWYNFVMTRTGSSTIFYVNGSSSSTFASGANINAGTAYLYEVSGVGGRNLNARFSNLQIYNRVLTADEISQNFNALRRRFSI